MSRKRKGSQNVDVKKEFEHASGVLQLSEKEVIHRSQEFVGLMREHFKSVEQSNKPLVHGDPFQIQYWRELVEAIDLMNVAKSDWNKVKVAFENEKKKEKKKKEIVIEPKKVIENTDEKIDG